MNEMKWVGVEGSILAVEHETSGRATVDPEGPPFVFLHANVADRRMLQGQW